MSSSGEEGKVVCVTGASGYIASWIVKFLLQRGYTVRATVRDPSNPNKVDHLLKLDGAKERLQLFKADLLEEGSFDSAIQGCHGVFHTASPVHFVVDDPQTQLIDPAVKGTLNVLKSCAKSGSVKRVVLTSSIATALYNGKPRTPEVVVDETWFSNPQFLLENKMWYQFAKTSAEEAANKFLTENNIDYVVMNPAVVIGPLLQPELNDSSSLILNLINGSETFLNAAFGWINVKDVANVHIQAYEDSSASGRYCLVERVIHFSELTKILRDMYPTLQIPNKCADDKPLMQTFQVSKEKAKKLGSVEFIPLEVSLKEIVESLKEKKFADF
ncbi:cinnamoyl-CoA reductase CAD2-like [Vicia villosa]|uniref:cinnamoyl-CoA reductase CAD2-like n=1 Tax=Vicia villosa TaxID=3911 RepID=UPI00273CBA5C|nr:cinnamoyl-CoA reductase CAD2-like [Vicia villosa]